MSKDDTRAGYETFASTDPTEAAVLRGVEQAVRGECVEVDPSAFPSTEDEADALREAARQLRAERPSEPLYTLHAAREVIAGEQCAMCGDGNRVEPVCMCGLCRDALHSAVSSQRLAEHPRPTTPIERMIDKATGYRPGSAPHTGREGES